MGDPFDLRRFLDAQDRGDTYAQAVDEVRRGRKVTHWIWFVFPQLAGLGRSPTARRYAISSLEEARAYVEHPILGERLRESIRTLLAVTGLSAEDIFGGLDAMKVRSSMTLFARVEPVEALCTKVIDRYFEGRFDGTTDQLLRGE